MRLRVKFGYAINFKDNSQDKSDDFKYDNNCLFRFIFKNDFLPETKVYLVNGIGEVCYLMERCSTNYPIIISVYEDEVKHWISLVKIRRTQGVVKNG
jgi:hypothetical protein